MALAIAYAHLEKCTFAGKRKILMQTGATLLFVLGIFCTLKILRAQASSPSYTEIQAGQMVRRPILALSLGAVLISLPFSIRPLRLLFGNPVTRFLSGISMNFYLLHQSVAVHLKRLGIPFSEFELPNQAGDRVWQMRYSLLCVGISLVLAVLVTYLVEKPCSRLLAKLFKAKKERQS
jgi:peptidoglycan/LPS O-acetylase OafA/YrhL